MPDTDPQESDFDRMQRAQNEQFARARNATQSGPVSAGGEGEPLQQSGSMIDRTMSLVSAGMSMLPNPTTFEGARDIASGIASQAAQSYVPGPPQTSVPLTAGKMAGQTLLKMGAAGLGGLGANEGITQLGKAYGIEDPNPTSRRSLEFLAGSVGELGAPVLGGISRRGQKIASKTPGFRRLFKPDRFADEVLPAGAELKAASGAMGAPMRAGLISENTLVDRIENVTEKAIGAGMGTFQRKSERTVTQKLNEFVGEIGTMVNRDMTGQVAKDVALKSPEIAKKPARAIYRRMTRASRAAGGSGEVDVTLIRRAMVAKRLELEKRLVDPKSDVMQWLKRAEKRMEDMGDSMPWEDLQAVRSGLGDLAAVEPGMLADVTHAAASSLMKDVNGAFKRAAAKLGPGMEGLVNQADAIWRSEVNGETERKVLSSIARKYPEQVLGQLMKKNDITFIRKMREMIQKSNRPEVWERIQGEFRRKMLSAMTDPIDHKVSGKSLTKFLDGYDEGVLEQMLGLRGQRDLMKMARVLAKQQQQVGGREGGSMTISLMQAGSTVSLGVLLGSVAAGQEVPGPVVASTLGTAALVFGGPIALGKALRDDNVINFLTVGAQAVPGSQMAARATSQLLARLIDLDIPFEMKRAEVPPKPIFRASKDIDAQERNTRRMPKVFP